jgi:hypothetical protein
MTSRSLIRAVVILVLLGACKRAPARARPASVNQAVPSPTVVRLTQRAYTRSPLNADTTHHAERNLPEWVQQTLIRRAFFQRYALFYEVNPFYVSGRLDSDSIGDVALQIIEKSSGKRGIAFVQGRDSSVRFLGAGTPQPNGVDDLRDVWFWRIEGRSALREEPVQGIEIIRLGASPSEWSIVWWNGARYIWYNPPID